MDGSISPCFFDSLSQRMPHPGALAILLVDTNPDDRAGIGSLLDGSGCRLLVAGDGDQAGQLLDIHASDVALIVIDVQLEGMDGYTLARAIHEHPDRRHIPIILVTAGLREDAAVLRGYETGALDYLVRPLNSVMLRSKINALLELGQGRRRLARLYDALNLRMQQHSLSDSLTGVLNRHSFLQSLESELARARRGGHLLAVFSVDLDNFKRINDAFGHRAGDEVLRTVATRLREHLRPYDVVARLGDDDFAILAEGLGSEDQIAHIAEKILAILILPHDINGLHITVGASVGIAVFPHCGESAEQIVQAAGMAMLRAKSEGRNEYRFYSTEMNGRARARLMLEESLRRAIAGQEFELYFQPQMRADSGHLRGFEALLRWQHVTAGLVQPGVFVPVLEEAGFIQQLGPWIINTTCRQISAWQHHLPPGCCIGLNLSSAQFACRDLVGVVADAIERHGIEAHQLELEVTESTLITNVDHTRLVLRQLRDLGVRTAIDDFGTGYSSMAYLKQFEVDTLKIDRMFISGLPHSSRDAAIAHSITQLGHNLGMEIIAEGVETREQLSWLQSIGCDTVQGFYYARPEPARELFVAV